MNILTTEIIGYIATGLTLSSFLFTDMVRLRTVNLVGCLWWCAYALSFEEIQMPVLLVNGIIMTIHSVWLLKNYFNKSSK